MLMQSYLTLNLTHPQLLQRFHHLPRALHHLDPPTHRYPQLSTSSPIHPPLTPRSGEHLLPGVDARYPLLMTLPCVYL